MDIIRKRRSIRAYKDKPLPKETIDAILEAARYAPTARNLQQLEYKVITNKGLIKKISDRLSVILGRESPWYKPRDAGIFHGAPLLVIITGPQENDWINSDAALAVQNIMLYATSIGLGSCFIGLARHIEADKEMMRELNIAEGRKIAAAVICGYPDESPPEKEKRINAEFFE